jgi:hypothetical protein
MRAILRLTAPAVLLLVCACSSDQDLQGEHVWKEQTDTIQKAEDVQEILQDAAQQQRADLEDQDG